LAASLQGVIVREGRRPDLFLQADPANRLRFSLTHSCGSFANRGGGSPTRRPDPISAKAATAELGQAGALPARPRTFGRFGFGFSWSTGRATSFCSTSP
jgi:hypothetical protein